jgi:NAD(P)-dependent dehydrogenase (short-subunit alcohol dehydrogenase family)
MLMKDRCGLVTGAASGMGEATAKRIAAEGGHVVVADLDLEGGQRVVDEILESGGSAVFCRTDVTDEESVEAMVRTVVDNFGRLDFASNNAGLAHRRSAIHTTSLETWDRVNAVNERGLFLCLRAEIPHMLSGGTGSIVNTISGAGLGVGGWGQGPYVASKHGAVGLTKQAASEYAGQGIRINGLAPGATLTGMFRDVPQERMQEFLAGQPMGRLIDPVEIANGVVWLLSDQSSAVTGTILVVDGGASVAR